jgi:hypothetical protein
MGLIFRLLKGLPCAEGAATLALGPHKEQAKGRAARRTILWMQQ